MHKQPALTDVYDSLIRVDGATNLGVSNSGAFGAIAARSQLFVRQGADISISNLTTGGFFPSDQTFVTLAVRVWTFLRRPFRSNTDARNWVKSVNISVRDNTEPSFGRNTIAGVESKTECQTGTKSIEKERSFSVSPAPYNMRVVMCSELYSDVQIAGEISATTFVDNKSDFRLNLEMVAPATNTAGAANNMPGVTASLPMGSAPAAVYDRLIRVHKLYHQSENQLFWQLTAGDKPQLTHFTAYTPMAGGLDGFFADSSLPRANNGVPTSSALMRLARPVLIPPRQGFSVIAILATMGTAVGADLITQLNGLAATAVGVANGTNTADSIEKDVKYLNKWGTCTVMCSEDKLGKSVNTSNNRENTEASIDGNIFATVETGAARQTAAKLAVEKRFSSESPGTDRNGCVTSKLQSDLHSDMQFAGEITAMLVEKTNNNNSIDGIHSRDVL